MICIKCNSSKDESNYPLRKRGSKSSTCKNCILNARREKNKDNQVTKKICSNCNTEKNIGLFPMRNGKPNGTLCKECFNKKLKSKRIDDKVKKIVESTNIIMPDINETLIISASITKPQK